MDKAWIPPCVALAGMAMAAGAARGAIATPPLRAPAGVLPELELVADEGFARLYRIRRDGR